MSETQELVDIRLDLGAEPHVRMFRNNNGVWQDKAGNWVTYGLGPGTSDLIGFREVLITPEMVGRTVAVFSAIEVKRKGRRTTKKKRFEQQRDFIHMVIHHGGLAGFARSPDDARQILNQPPGIKRVPK